MTKEKRPFVGVGVMIMRDGKILLGRRKGSHGAGEYAFPGGHLRYGETFEECAKRETREECGLEIEIVRFLCVSNIIKYGKHYVDIEILAESDCGEPKVLEPNKRLEWNWYKLDRIPGPLFEMCKKAVESYKTGRFYFDK